MSRCAGIQALPQGTPLYGVREEWSAPCMFLSYLFMYAWEPASQHCPHQPRACKLHARQILALPAPTYSLVDPCCHAFQAPFRLTRIVIFGALAAGAGLGLFIILGRLAQAVRGGEGAPDLNESLTNLAINGAALAVLSFLLVRDLRARDKDAAVTAREEALSRLLVKLSGGRLLPLIRFRGAVRPVIVAGDRSFVDRAVKAAEEQKAALRERGVSIVPVVYGSESDPEEKLRALKREWGRETAEQPRKGFGAGSSGAASSGPVAGAEAEPQAAAAASPITEQDKRWQLEAAELQEWEEWIEAQKEFAGMVKDRRNCWVQVQLDGTVRASGVGQVPWGRLVNDLPLMGSLQTTTSDGIISDV